MPIFFQGMNCTKISKIHFSLFPKFIICGDYTRLNWHYFLNLIFSQEKQKQKNKPQMNKNKLQRQLEIHWASLPKLISLYFVSILTPPKSLSLLNGLVVAVPEETKINKAGIVQEKRVIFLFFFLRLLAWNFQIIEEEPY